MNKIKEKILKSIIPDAVLYPMTEDAIDSLIKSQHKKNIIKISDLLRIGREARLDESDRGIFIKLRLISKAEPNNDVYLIDNNKFLQISKEHFLIEKIDKNFILKDRGSTNGMVINDVHYGGDNQEFENVLKDGDIIKIGSMNSTFVFQFLILEV